MPATGFTVTVRKSETIDLDITVDQAIQFVVSCGVVVPIGQRHENGILLTDDGVQTKERSDQPDADQPDAERVDATSA